MRSTMVFYNHCIEGETLSTIIALPFDIKIINVMSNTQLYALSKVLDLSVSDETLEKGYPILDLIRQKLYDLYYNVEDGVKVHGVMPCQSRTRKCPNLASLICGNHMCKICCQDCQICNTCIAHDRHDEFLRFKIRDMNRFEEEKAFDRKKTLRLTFRRTIRKYELEKALENYEIVSFCLKKMLKY
jgi:hypothetical protein